MTDDYELYFEEQRQILLDTKKEIKDLVTLIEHLDESYVAPKDEVKVSGKLEVNTEKQIEVTNLGELNKAFIDGLKELEGKVTKAIKENKPEAVKNVAISNIKDAKADKVAITNLDELKKELQDLKKDFIASVEQLDLNVNIEKQEFPTQANKPIAVRLSDGKSFYNAITTALSGVALPFKDTNNKGTQVALDSNGNLPVSINGTITGATLSSSIQANDSPSIDAFARWRVSNPETIFDSKQIHSNQPLFWDDQEVSGGGTSSTWSQARASTTIGVSNATAGKRVRQTFQRFNYQPGKSQLIFLTGVLGNQPALVGASMGLFDDNNGIYCINTSGIALVGIRSSASGSVENNTVAQTSWNLDRMDGTGASGVNLDFDKTQIFMIDFEWLGVGRVRVGWVIDGIPIYCHEFNHANSETSVYMSTPNLPLRYEITNTGTGSTSTMEHICSSVISEGGSQANGILRHKDSGAITGLSAGTVYAVLGIRLKSANLDASVLLENLSVLATTTNDFAHWELRINPTVAGTFTYSDETNSVVQTATGANTNTVTGGTEIDGGYFSTALPITNTTPNALKLGSKIDGTADKIVLCARPITNNIGVQGSLTWREQS